MVIERVRRPSLETVPVARGKRARLYRLLYEHGPDVSGAWVPGECESSACDAR